MGGYPAGAEFDSRAPYNQPDGVKGLCRYCDSDQIEEQLNIADYETIDAYEDALYELKHEAGLCSHCRAEEIADMSRDDY